MIDPEDVIEGECYILCCTSPTQKIYWDRVYMDKELAKKRQEYLNKISNGRGEWVIFASEYVK